MSFVIPSIHTRGVKRAAPGSTAKPATGSTTKPTPGSTAKPATGSATKPAPGSTAKPATGSILKTATGSITKAATGSITKIVTGNTSKAAAGSITKTKTLGGHPLPTRPAHPATNGVKKKKPLIKPALAAKQKALENEMEKLWVQDTHDNMAVLNVLQDLKRLEGRSDAKEERLSLWRKAMDKITEMFDRRFDRLVRYECGRAGTDPKSMSEQLSFMVNTLFEKHKDDPITPEWIRWAMSKLLLSLTGKIVYDMMGADICYHLQQLLKLLWDDKRETAALMNTIIEQMHTLTQQSKSISLTLPSAPANRRVEIQIDLKNGCETVIMLTLVDLLIIHPGFDFASLPVKSQLQLWASLFHLARSPSQNAQHSSVQLMHRLLVNELASVEIVRVVVDYAVALLKASPPTKGESDKKINLRDSIVTIVQLLTEHLRKLARSRMLKGAQATVLIGWASSVLGLAQTWSLESVDTERRPALNGHRNVLRSFAIACCRLLTSIRTTHAADYLKTPLKQLEEAVKRLITSCLHEWALSSSPSKSSSSLRPGSSITPTAVAAAAEERVACAAGLLLFADDLNGNEENSMWISKEADATLAACSDRVEAALRARHLIISSLAPKTRARRAPAPSSQDEKPTTGAATPSTRALLNRLLPDEAQILQYISSVESLPPDRGTAVLQALFSLVAQMIPLSSSMTATAVAVLSLPWMATDADILTSCKRHFRGLPLLKELQQRRAVVKNACTASSLLRECTLAPLASLPRPAIFSEWRRAIFEKALVLNPSKNAPSQESVSIIKSALASLPQFVASVEMSAFERTLALVLELVDMEKLERSPVHIEHVVRAVTDSLCALDGVSRRQNEATGDYRCTACDRLQRDGVPTAKEVKMPKDFGKLMVKVFTDDSIRQNTIENRIDAYSILFAMLCHVQDAVKRFQEVMIASLSLITDKDEEVRKEYAWTFKVILSMNPSQVLMQAIKKAFDIDDTVDMDDEERAICETSAPFLAHCASEGHDVSFRKWARELMYVRAMNHPKSAYLTELAAQLHVSEAKKDAEIGEDPLASTRFFVRQTRTLTSHLSKELLQIVSELAEEAAETKCEEEVWMKQAIQHCDWALQVAATIWGFDSISSLLRTCASHLVADCFVVDTKLHKEVTVILERIRVHLDRERRSLIEECVPAIVERIVQAKDASQSATVLARNYCGASMRDLLDTRRYHCTFFLLRLMGNDQSKTLSMLLKINRLDTGSLTEVLKMRCEYLGYLLSLRRSLLEDESYDLRTTILSSIRVIITLLDDWFLDDIASKMMMVLRAATIVGEAAVEVWTAFVERLGNEVLVSLLPQILIAVQPLLRFESSQRLLETIFEQREALKNEESESFERAVMVLLGGGSGSYGDNPDDDGSARIRKYLNKTTPPSSEDVILGCARMLTDEGETVGRVVLKRLESTLDGRPLRDDIAAAVMPALLHTIRVCTDADVRLAASKCIGMVGAVDPGRLGLSKEEQRRAEEKEFEYGRGSQTRDDGRGKKMLFVKSSNYEFFVDLLERAWRVYASLTDADMIDIASFGIQSLLFELVGTEDEHMIFQRLSSECQHDIAPFLKTSLTNHTQLKGIDANGQPIVNVVSSFPEWLLQNFLQGIVGVKGGDMRDIFKALKWLVYTRDTSFARYLLPHVIIALVQESNQAAIDRYGNEMVEVLRRTIDTQSPNWIRLAAHVVFSIVDTLERFTIWKSEAMKKDGDYARVVGLIKRVCSEKLADGTLLVVVAAERCQCLLRALRWCEQFAIGGGVTGFGQASEDEDTVFDRAPFYGLQRLYSKLNEVDGVVGAFEIIAKNTLPTADERILALEANGDYTEALPLYAYSGEQKELKLLECLLRLNQPQLALSRAAMEERGSARDASTARAIEDAQLEAASHLRDWGRLDEMIKKRDPLSSGESGWGAACASIMNSIHHRKGGEIISVKTDRARSNLVERLTALTIEDSDTYAQSYKYIAQLHMLAEIDDTTEQLLSDSIVPRESVDNIMHYWEERSDSVTQDASIIEPMLRVRRELLRAAGGEKGETTKGGVTRLLLQSCRLARQAGHLQIAWTFLVEAKALETCHQAVGMEEARFEFQKGNQSEAIGLLSRLINTKYSKMQEIFTVYAKQGAGTSQSANEPIARSQCISVGQFSQEELKRSASMLIRQQPRQERAAFAEVQLLRTEYMLKAGASAPPDLYQTYIALKGMEVPSEDLHYRVAVYLDSLLNMAEPIQATNIVHILSSYHQVMQYGRSHMFHAVPRMLTIWLDVTQKLAEEMRTFPPTSSEVERRVRDIGELNNAMQAPLKQLPLSVFFPSFPQLISRILHPDKTVFDLLTMVLARLIGAFPHQCLWQAIAVYRDSPDSTQSEKMNKCKLVFEKARVMDKSKILDDLIDQYDYFAKQLISIAENEKVKHHPEKLISRHFTPLHNFFKENKMDTRLLLNAKERKLVGVRSVTPRIMIPMTEMLEQSISEKEEVKILASSQFNVFESPQSVASAPIVEEVFIQGIEDKFVVMSSLQAPRRLTLRGSDGKKYGILCKKDDELRKDARLISFCKMMNCLMRRTPEARRRQLMVRTFSAIPLQAQGGIIEWVPNLNTFKQTLAPLHREYQDKNLPMEEYSDKWTNEIKLNKLRHFYKLYPLVAAEWQRRAFSDPCSWHTARLLFTRSCAVMSMIGFVCGLGDRHAENLLVDQSDGGIMHVDFNILFNRGELLKVPENVPFRLTRNIVDGFGPTGAEGAWRKSAEATLEVMRANAETLLTVMQAFIYDPLIEFGEARAQQNKTGQRKAEEKKTKTAEVLEMIKLRLEGHIVTPKTTAKKHYLTKKMSVSGQVAKLLELATDEVLLSQMFSGWSPYL